MHDAGAALRGIATDMGAGQAQVFAQKLHQQRPWIDVRVHGIAVHDQGDFRHSELFHRHCSILPRSAVISVVSRS
jgi:hypothetical protein